MLNTVTAYYLKEMAPTQSLKTIIVETVLFICLFALVGHLSVNFWERYVIQNELAKMKSSLHYLKETIKNIGVAYDTLHRELVDLAELAESGKPGKQHSDKEKSILGNFNRNTKIQAHLSTVDKKLSATPATADKCSHNIKRKKNKCISTLTKSPVMLDKESSLSWKHYKETRIRPITASTMTRNTSKSLSYFSPKTNTVMLDKDLSISWKNNKKVLSKPIERVDISTITRYPLKSTGTGRKLIYSR